MEYKVKDIIIGVYGNEENGWKVIEKRNNNSIVKYSTYLYQDAIEYLEDLVVWYRNRR